MITHARFRDLLCASLDDSLTELDRLEFQDHVRECTDCARLAQSLTDALRELRSFPRLDVPPGFVVRVLERTSRRPFAFGRWEYLGNWLRLPRIAPAGAAALLAFFLLVLAGTRDGRQVAREISMATHRSYSNTLRLYHRSEDLRETAVAVGQKIPGQFEETVGWIRRQIRGGGDREQPQTRPAEPSRESRQTLGNPLRA